ncbi:hypothetical protein RCL1_005919 [Eukaryota sp. TZLM3-RCL]
MSDVPPFLALIHYIDDALTDVKTVFTFAYSARDAHIWIAENIRVRLLSDARHVEMFKSIRDNSSTSLDVIKGFEDEILPHLEIRKKMLKSSLKCPVFEWIVTECIPDGREFESSTFPGISEESEEFS